MLSMNNGIAAGGWGYQEKDGRRPHRDEADARRDPAVGERDAQLRGDADGGGDPRHDVDRDAALPQVLELLPSAAEDERVAPLEANHPSASAGKLLRFGGWEVGGRGVSGMWRYIERVQGRGLRGLGGGG